ncbi:MAG: DUF2442 domain-containing protein [Thermoguttaceae bacterium]
MRSKVPPIGPRVVKVVPYDDYTLLLTFTNNETKKFDVSPFLNKGVFTELQNIGYFRCVRLNGAGSIEWPNEQDFCPDTLYLKSTPVE